MPALPHPDNLPRCPWPKQDALYVAYHDEEWGVAGIRRRALFEKLVLDGFQAGLSWITICASATISAAPSTISSPTRSRRYTPKKIERLMQDAGIVRNRAQIEGAVGSGARLLADHGKRARLFRDAMEARRRQAIDHKLSSRSRTPTESG